MNDALTLAHLGSTAGSVTLAVLPLLVLFLVFQALFLRLPVREVRRLLTGTLLAAAGLFLFLLGVGIAFLPFGRIIGEALGALPHGWLLIPFGLVLGFVTTRAEPAVGILAEQVEEASGGAVRRDLVVLTICVGVAVFVAIGMSRIRFDIPLLYLLVPGYGIFLVFMWFSKAEFVAIGIDAGGVASGPLANSFLLALAFGVSSATGGQDPLVHGLGLVALIALAPALSLVMLGMLLQWKDRRKET